MKDSIRRNVLFICSRNKWRSPTAETIWRKYPKLNVRSAGTSPRAKRTVSFTDISWADVIFVMEQKHQNRLKAKFTRLLEHKHIHILDIPDDYKYMDTELVQILEESVSSYLNL
jgi:predicted protein tyrosine phosphatase